MNQTIIEAVRVRGADGIVAEYPWDPVACYLIRDDHPYLEIRTRGHRAQFKRDPKNLEISEPCEAGMQWQKWDLSEELSRKRRFGEISAALKVPKDCILRCYVIPAALLSYRDVLKMVEDVEAELRLAVAWDNLADVSDRSWSRPLVKPRSMVPNETLDLIEEEIRAAASIRRDPFMELGPVSTSATPLPENALVSQWAIRRSGQLRALVDDVETGLKSCEAQSALKNPEMRQVKIDEEVDRLSSLLLRSAKLSSLLARFVDDVEVGMPIQLSPLFQRDYRLRLLLRAFSPNPSEAIAEIESARSSYPPIILTHLWELWGIVWIAMEFRKLGFSGICSVEAIETVKRCSWHLTKDGVTIKLDFEADPAFIDYEHMPPLHERAVPALEWAARHQKINVERPFLGSELRCSPDYLIRITTPSTKALLVGDASLASPQHHGKKGSKTPPKPQTVERYRRTIGWVDGDQLIRCHPMGAFVVFPPPAHAWTKFEIMVDARDCMLLCPSPQGDVEASRRLMTLLESIVPELHFSGSIPQ